MTKNMNLATSITAAVALSAATLGTLPAYAQQGTEPANGPEATIEIVNNTTATFTLSSIDYNCGGSTLTSNSTITCLFTSTYTDGSVDIIDANNNQFGTIEFLGGEEAAHEYACVLNAAYSCIEDLDPVTGTFILEIY